MEVAEGVLVDEPTNSTASATLAIVHLRLETLPWIAKLMARSRPDSSLAEAELHARASLDVAGPEADRDARVVLITGAARSATHWRDRPGAAG